MSTRDGPMAGQEIVFIVTKGRFTKKDISITITEPTIGWTWTATTDQFSINSNIIYFPMPTFPCPQMTRAKVMIVIHCKEDKVYQGIYLYTSLVDRMHISCLSLSPSIIFISYF